MKTFKCVVVVKYPRDLVWSTIQDRLSEVVPFMDDIEKVTVVERHQQPDGIVRLVNVWRASPSIPPLLSTVITPEMLAWTDRAEWRPQTYQCHWRIEPHFYPERTQCSGTTRYESAIGGRGTRLTFEGQLDVDITNLARVPFMLGETLSRGVESFVTTLVPKNFRKLTNALSAFLGDQRPRPEHGRGS